MTIRFIIPESLKNEFCSFQILADNMEEPVAEGMFHITLACSVKDLGIVILDMEEITVNHVCGVAPVSGLADDFLERFRIVAFQRKEPLPDRRFEEPAWEHDRPPEATLGIFPVVRVVPHRPFHPVGMKECGCIRYDSGQVFLSGLEVLFV